MIPYILAFTMLAGGLALADDDHGKNAAAAPRDESCPVAVTTLRGSESLTDYVSKTDGVRFTFRLANYKVPSCEDFLKYRKLFRELGDQRKHVGHVQIEEAPAGRKGAPKVLDFSTDENGKLNLHLQLEHTADDVKPVVEKAVADLAPYLEFYRGMNELFGNRLNVGYQDPRRFADPEVGNAIVRKFATVKDDILELTKSFPVKLDPRAKNVRLQEEVPVRYGKLFRQVHVGLDTPAAELQQTLASYRARRSLSENVQRDLHKATGLNAQFSLNLSEAEMRQAADRLAKVKDQLAAHPAKADTRFLVLPASAEPSSLRVREGFLVEYNVKDDPAVLSKLLAQAKEILE